jgi:polyisoprenyl-phosphate glycosyltransferase
LKKEIQEVSSMEKRACGLSIICPVQNEQDNLLQLYNKIKIVLSDSIKWELIFIDDGSTDGSVEVMKEMCSSDGRVKAVVFSKNFGHQIALTAGYDIAEGEAVISMDSDLQHPPEALPEMLRLWKAGSDIVFAIRKDHKQQSVLKKATSKWFYSFLNKISDVDLIQGAADFRLLDKKVILYLRQYRESSRFLRGIIGDLGFKRTIISYDEEPRISGDSKYSFRKMLKLALSGILSYSSFPLRISAYIGVIISVFCIFYAISIIYEKIVNDVPIGLASITVGVFFLGSIQLISIGILGEYLSNVFLEVKQRPLYCINEIIEHQLLNSNGNI